LSPQLQSTRQTTTLGRTGLRCSVAGLGCGGMSRLGLRRGGTMSEAADLVRYALDLGITYIDTARVYGTEPAVGAALQGRRDGVVVSTKVWPLAPDGSVEGGRIAEQVDDSLRVLGLDTIDVCHLHGVTPKDYRLVLEECLEPLQRAKRAGKIRHLGISELWNHDLPHAMLRTALTEDHFDVILAGCNMLNSSARLQVFPAARRAGVATVLMFAVRRAFADPALLRSICARLVADGQVDPDALDPADPLGFLIGEHCPSLTEAAYRYCRHLPGVDVVLTGTSRREHLLGNVAAIEAAPLPEADLRRVDAIFARVDSVTGEA
jgi:L-galactose dehydrogenase